MKAQNTLVCLAIIFFLPSCGPNHGLTPGPVFVEPALQEYYQRYIDYKKHYLGTDVMANISIYFEPLEGPIIGSCSFFSDGSRVIKIDPNFWIFTTDADRELLMLHELGHCDLLLGHSMPLSIMEEFHIGGQRYSADKNYYLNQLFGLQPTIFPASMVNNNQECNH